MIDNSDSHHCYIHDESGDSAWWWNHRAEKPHDYTGDIAPCQYCGKPEQIVTFIGCLHDRKLPPAFCDDCKKMLGMK
ncbi:MAG: hypothetical protein KGI08_10095 [Thaumarchaeota archaeon]|nr:hypothetical protein [Nitrososphaerota archaeon]